MTTDERSRRDRSLRGAVLAGDENAWRTLYERGFGPLLGFVRRRCNGDEHRVDEVLQEVWMIVVRRLRKFDPDQGPFEAWIVGIARNVLRNAWRKDRRDALAGAIDADLVSEADTAAAADLERAERTEQVALAMGTLPGHYRAVLRAKYSHDLTVSEIADRTLTTPKAVESLLSRARTAFRHAYRELDGQEDHHGS